MSFSFTGTDNKENRYCQRICSGTGGPSTLGGLVAAGAACLGAGLVRRLVKKQCSLQGMYCNFTIFGNLGLCSMAVESLQYCAEELYETRQRLCETDGRLGEISLALETVE